MKPFKFDEVKDFDAHIHASIPSFHNLNFIVKSLCEAFAQNDTMVVDLGCSTGRLLRSLEKKELVEYVGIDNCFTPDDDPKIIFKYFDIWDAMFDLQTDVSVFISLFTLQFLPVSKRSDVLKYVKEKLVDGGIFICAEKVHLENPAIESVVQSTLLEWKLNSFSKSEVLDKTIGLKNVMHSRTQSQLVKELSAIGKPSVIWSWGQFICYAVQNISVK